MIKKEKENNNNNNNNNDNNDNQNENENENEDEKDDNIDENNWLLRDKQRNTFLNNLEYTEKNVEKVLKYIGRYLNRVIPTSDDLQEHEGVQELYIPIEESSKDINVSFSKHVISALFDGVLFSVLINMIEPEFIDLRALHFPNPESPLPLEENKIRENMATVFSSARALDLEVAQWTLDDYFDKKQTVIIMISLILQLFRGLIDGIVNIKHHAELIRLCQTEEEKENASSIKSKEWIKRWLLYLNAPKRHGQGSPFLILESNTNNNNNNNNTHKSNTLQVDEQIVGRQRADSEFKEEDVHKIPVKNVNELLQLKDWHQDLLSVCEHLDLNFKKNDILLLSHQQQCVSIMKSVIENIKARSIVTLEDITIQNPLLQEMLLADIFHMNSNIEQISTTEKKRLTQIIKVKSKDDTSVIAWINSMGNMHVNNLDRDISDGIIILKLLDKAKLGSVKWKNVRKHCRHKFDRLGNCKMAVDICQSDFPFSLVGIGGSDIVDGNQKFIRTLMWQIMRYHATKVISELSFGGKAVTDEDMLIWANIKIKNFQLPSNVDIKLKSEEIKTWKDLNLSNCIFYINLLASIELSWVRYDLVNYIPPVKDSKVLTTDSYSKQRLANARYVMTIVRRLGGDLFMLVEDLCTIEQRAVFSMIASIMTIEAKYSKGTLNDYIKHAEEEEEFNKIIEKIDP